MNGLRGKWSKLACLGFMSLVIGMGSGMNGCENARVAERVHAVSIEEENAELESASQTTEIDPDPELLKHRIIYDGDTTSTIGGAAQTKAVKSPFTTSTYCHAKRFAGYQVQHGIDVSQWQGSIDWNKVRKSGVTFAIIRV